MISSLVKIVMQECGLKQKALAGLLGVSVDRIKSITSGRVQKLTREESEALVKKLHIRAEWLVTGSGPMFHTAAESEFQRRLDVVGNVSRQATAAYLRPDQIDLLQRITMAAEMGDSATLRRLLHPLSEREAALLDDYERMSDEDRRALERTAAGLAATPATVIARPSAREYAADEDRRSRPREIGEKQTPSTRKRKTE